jgi:hypothetical protein
MINLTKHKVKQLKLTKRTKTNQWFFFEEAKRTNGLNEVLQSNLSLPKLRVK